MQSEQLTIYIVEDDASVRDSLGLMLGLGGSRGIQTAFSQENKRLRRTVETERLALLTAREREVLEHAAQGLHAKEISRKLGISVRTVEVHKTRLMGKLGVRNVAELVRFVLSSQVPPNVE